MTTYFLLLIVAVVVFHTLVTIRRLRRQRRIINARRLATALNGVDPRPKRRRGLVSHAPGQ
jgi:hypothetical protein